MTNEGNWHSSFSGPAAVGQHFAPFTVIVPFNIWLINQSFICDMGSVVIYS